MPGGQDIYASSRKLISFVGKYTDLMERHMNSVRDMMTETCELVMSGINDIALKTSGKKEEAEQILVNTYTKPDEETAEAMKAVQDATEAVFEKAAASSREKDVDEISSEASDELKDKVRRAGGLFSKHMQALSSLDGEVQDMLLTMMGALSRDDVVKQKLEHAAAAMHALQTSLSYILVDYDARCRGGEVDKFIGDLKDFAYNSYTTRDEREFFFEAFPEEKDVRLKAVKKSS